MLLSKDQVMPKLQDSLVKLDSQAYTSNQNLLINQQLWLAVQWKRKK